MPAPDYFEFFGLERKLFLDPDDLQRRFYRLSRELHPDRFSRASETERERALDASAVLNDAYRTLRDPVSRAESLLGTDTDDRVPADLLEEVFAANEAIEEMDAAAMEAARIHFQSRLAASDAELAAAFPRYDAGALTAADVRTLLHRRRYIQKLVRQLEQAHV